MSLQETKECACCGRIFYKRKSDSITQWRNRKFCSISCLNKSRDFIPIHLRFWKFVKRLSNESCWEWLGATDGHGYGAITNTATSSPIKAHRLSYEIHYGEIPEGKVICHHCDNPICVNPHHLFAGSPKDNMQDCSAKGRINPKSIKNLVPGKKGYLGAAVEKNKCEWSKS